MDSPRQPVYVRIGEDGQEYCIGTVHLVGYDRFSVDRALTELFLAVGLGIDMPTEDSKEQGQP
jgi:hypothetical protein